MSSSYVRKIVRDLLGEQTETPFYDTINRAPDYPEDEYWCSAEFSVIARDTTTFCGDTEETGFVQILIFGPPGVGDLEFIERAEVLDRLLRDFIDPNNRLEFSPGMTGDANAVNGHYGYMLYLQYDLR